MQYTKIIILFISYFDSPEIIANKIVERAGLLKTENNNFVLSAVVPRDDKLNEKAEKANRLL